MASISERMKMFGGGGGSTKKADTPASEPPEGEPRCHGLLQPLGTRYARGLAAGTSLLAYEAVWGARLPAAAASSGGAGSAGARQELRVSRPTALANAPFARAYAAHAARTAAGAGAGAADDDASAAAGAVRLLNHLSQPALLCRGGSAADARRAGATMSFP